MLSSSVNGSCSMVWSRPGQTLQSNNDNDSNDNSNTIFSLDRKKTDNFFFFFANNKINIPIPWILL